MIEKTKRGSGPNIEDIKKKYPYLKELYSENVLAKIWGVAKPDLEKASFPQAIPEISYGRYNSTDYEYWTCGFFPGSIYALLERAERHPSYYAGSDKINKLKLRFAAQWWSELLYSQQTRTDTHDLAFIIQPALRREYELYSTGRAHDAVVNAAYHLATRYNPHIGLIKSWNLTRNKRYSYNEDKGDYLVIIDNMMNLDMLFWAAKEKGDVELSTIAFRHAEKTLKEHLRYPDFSTYHLINYDSTTGEPKAKLTNQGYSDSSTWSRGQAWAISGFANCYQWTHDLRFLEAAEKCAKYFLKRLSDDGVPSWDFDAPSQDIKDASAGLIAAKGLITLYSLTEDTKFLDQALFIVNGIIKYCLAPKSSIDLFGNVDLGDRDTILTDSTANNNPDAFKTEHSHGLSYADYYFIEFGNSLLDLGLKL